MHQFDSRKSYIKTVISRCGRLFISPLSHVRPYLFATALLVGTLGSTLLTSAPTYAAPGDHNNQADCENAEYEWDGDANKCVEPATSSCGIEGIGWVVCPVMDFLGGVADMAFNFLADSFLSINSEYVTSDSIENAWGAMRTLANVVFVIAFLVIIFSQLTSTGISNYGVKKLLPRLIIAAILVNMSLIICQIAVDISNILGYSLKTLFDTLGNDVLLQRPVEDPTGMDTALEGLGWAALIAALIAGGITLALSISGPVLLAAVLALLLIAIILVARIALIVTLTIISPLAFVAFLLPNTEQWFKKWYKMFLALLMVFPVIAVVFGASALVAEIINETAAPRDAAGNPTGDPNLLMQVIAMGVATVPLFLVPSLLKNSMSAAGSIGNKLAGWSSKANSRVGGKVRDTSRLGEAQRGLKNKMALNRAVRRGKNPIGRVIDNSKFGKRLGLDKGAAAAMSAVDKQDEQDVSQELTRFKNMNGATDLDGASREMTKAIADGDSVKARAMQRYLAGAGGAGVKALEKVYSGSSDGIRANGSLQQSLASDALGLGMKGKSAAIDSFSTDGKRSFNDIQQDQSTYTRLGAAELAGQKNLGKLMDDGIISSDMAQAVMSSPDARDLMSVGDRGTMAGLAGTDLSGNPLSGGSAGASSGNPIPTAAGGGTSSPSGSSSAPSSGGGGSSGGSGNPIPTAAGGGTSSPSGSSSAPSSGGGGSSAGTAGGATPAGWEEHSSGLVIPHGAASGGGSSSSQPAPQQAAPASSTPQPALTNQEIEAAQAAQESQPKIVDKRGGDRPSFFSSKSSTPAPRPAGGSIDEAGRHTPSSASEDYHDRMSK